MTWEKKFWIVARGQNAMLLIYALMFWQFMAIIAKCPELNKDQYELLIDEVIKRVLIQAKYYRRKVGVQ